MCIIQASITPQCKTLGWSVSHFKLQKHESSFKHALFTAFIGCGVAQSSVCTACFLKMLKNQQRFHWHTTNWHRQYSSCCYGYSSHLHILLPVSYKNHSLTLLKFSNYMISTDRIFTLSFFLFFFMTTWAKAYLEGRFPDNMNWIWYQRSCRW